jgi:hypothetical protein
VFNKSNGDPTTILAVDPGKKACGVAYFVDGNLMQCALRQGDDAFDTALSVAVWFTTMPYAVVEHLVVEGQQIYGRPGTADPNDLIPLAQVVGGIFARVPHVERHNPLPRQWKGSVPKEIFTKRLRHALTPDEARLLSALKLPKSTEHNVLDAIGLGKWALACLKS